MKLYYAPGACSLAPHIVLRESGLQFSLVRVDLSTHRTADGRDFFQINPKGQVPVLDDASGERLTEGPVIAQLVADQAQAHSLMPAAGTTARYRVMAWQSHIGELHKAFSPLFQPDWDTAAQARFRRGVRDKLERIDDVLATSPYLTGNTFTAADAYLFAVARWSPSVGVATEDLQSLTAFMDRVASRPSVQAALDAERLGASH